MQVLTSSLTQTQLTPNCDALAFMQSTKKVIPRLKKKKKTNTWLLCFLFLFFYHVRNYCREKSIIKRKKKYNVERCEVKKKVQTAK